MNSQNLNKALSNQPSYRAKQANQLIFKNLISSWDEANSLPKNLRETLKKDCPLKINAEIFSSKDAKTQKALITLDDGSLVESVLMRHSDNHNTVCVSCQIGCSMACDFCATGKMGLKRNLNSDEILMQILLFARKLKQQDQRVSNIVFMGMGEPMLNYKNIMETIHILNDDNAFNIAARKISISTCGIIPGIEKLALEPLQLNLAISLHAPNDNLRSSIMPVNNSFNIKKTLSAVKKYIQKTGRKVMIEYILLKDINDNQEQAIELAQVLKKYLGNLFMINLIVYNATNGKYQSPTYTNKSNFKKTLEQQGLTVTQRYRLGHDIDGACGQLVTMMGGK